MFFAAPSIQPTSSVVHREIYTFPRKFAFAFSFGFSSANDTTVTRSFQEIYFKNSVGYDHVWCAIPSFLPCTVLIIRVVLKYVR